jgi:hypothetical protein
MEHKQMETSLLFLINWTFSRPFSTFVENSPAAEGGSHMSVFT